MTGESRECNHREDRGAFLERQGIARMITGSFLDRAPNFKQRTRAQASQSQPCHPTCSFFTITVEIHTRWLIQIECCWDIWDSNGKDLLA